MPPMNRRRVLLTGAAMLAAPPLVAAPRPYLLDRQASTVGFQFTLAGTPHNGTMPVLSANVLVDPSDLAASQVEVSVDAAAARTGLFFATQAMTGSEVLDTRQFPVIRFVSREVRLGPNGRLSEGAQLTGELTVKGVTKPVRFDAALYRKAGSAADDLSELSIALTGSISRSAFGADGYADLVPDPIGLNIRAVIRQAA